MNCVEEVRVVKRPFRPFSLTLSMGSAFLVAILVSLPTFSEFSYAIISWARFNELLTYSTMFAGPAVAAIAAYSGAIDSTIAIGPCPRRTKWELFFVRLFPLFISSILGWIIGLLPLLFLTARRATWGGPDLLILLTTLLLWLVWVCVGSLLGKLIPFPYSVVTAFGVGVLWWYLPEALTKLMSKPNVPVDSLSFLSVAPLWVGLHPGIGWHRTLEIGLFYLAFFTVLASSCIWIGANRRRLTILVLSCAIALGGLLVQPKLIASEEVAPDCRSESGVEVCLHPAEIEGFSFVDEGIQEAKKVLPTAAMPRGLSVFSSPQNNVVAFGLPINANNHDIVSKTVEDIGRWSVGSNSCGYNDFESQRQPTSEELAIESIGAGLYNQAFTQSGATPSDIAFAEVVDNPALQAEVLRIREIVVRMTPKEAGRAIALHQTQLQACDIAVVNGFDKK